MDALIDLARKFWYTTRRWWWSAYWGLRVRGVQNVPRSGPALFCGNHTSHLDAPAILAALPREVALSIATVAAQDVFGRQRPVRHIVGRVLTNCMPIERNANFSRGLRAMEDVLRRGRPMILFPEGRRSTSGKLLEFKPGAAMLAIRTGARIVPVRLEGVNIALPRGGRLLSPARVRVTFGAPIDPRSYKLAVESGRLGKHEGYAQLTQALRSAIDDL